MKNRLYIDGKDAFVEYGVFVRNGGYDALVAYAPLKKVESNDWPEEDGIEPDLSAPVLDTREFDVSFVLSGKRDRWDAFIELLSDGAYHTFDFREIGRIYRLRMVSNGNLDKALLPGFFSLRFADDFPLDDYAYAAPVSTVSPYGDYELDGRKLTDYGVRVLSGTIDAVEKAPAVKKNLLRNISNQNGALYDGEMVVFKSKDVTLNCLMRAGSLPELWQNYDALLYDLIRPKERILYVEATGEEYSCYYKNSSVSEFYASGKIWIRFSVVLTFIHQRPEELVLLSSESAELILTENDYAINLSSDGNKENKGQ